MTVLVRPIAYAEYRRGAESGDVLLCRAASLEGRFITEITGAEYSHASMAGWINPHRRDDPTASALMIAESVQHGGKRLIPLSGEIEQYSGYYDVYRVVDVYPRLFGHTFDGEAAFAWMARAANSRYGWSHLWRVLCRRHLCWPFDRLPPIANSEDPRAKRDCSAQVHAALRLNGGPTLKLNDCDCEPGDLANPKFLEYRWTLYATAAEVDAANEILDARRAMEAATMDAYENGAADWEDDDDAA